MCKNMWQWPEAVGSVKGSQQGWTVRQTIQKQAVMGLSTLCGGYLTYLARGVSSVYHYSMPFTSNDSFNCHNNPMR